MTSAPETMPEWMRRSDKRLLALERKPAGTTFWRGAYQAAACYEKGSIVTDNNMLLIAKRYTCNEPVVSGTVDADWDVLAARDELVVDSMPQPTPEAGWSVISYNSWVSGSLAWMQVTLSRDGTAITMNAYNNAQPGQTPDTTIFTVDADWQPSTFVDAHWQTGYISGGGAFYTDGTYKIRDGTPSGTISTSHDLGVTIGPYLLAGGSVSVGEATQIGSALELPFAKVYHNTAKTIISTDAVNASLDTPLTLDFTNPYAFPLRVRATYQPHLYIDAMSTTYMRIEMNGVAGDQDATSVGNTARKQYNGASGIWYDGLHMEAIFTVQAKATVTFEVVGWNTADNPTVNYGTLAAQALGAAGDGSVGKAAVWGRVRRTSNQTITRGTGDQHIDFTDGTVEGGFTWDSDGLIIPADGVYVAVVAVNAPYNQTGGGTNGHFTLVASGFYSAWCNTNTPNNNHRGTFQTPAHPIALTAGTRVFASINPMSADGTQTTIESADMYVFRVGDTSAPYEPAPVTAVEVANNDPAFATDWGGVSDGCRYRYDDRTVEVTFRVVKTANTTTPSTEAVFQLPAALAPKGGRTTLSVATVNGGSVDGPLCSGYVQGTTDGSPGRLDVAIGNTSTAWNSGTWFRIGGSWLRDPDTPLP